MKQKYILNPLTLQYQVYKKSFKQVFFKWSITTMLCFIVSFCCFYFTELGKFVPTALFQQKHNKNLIEKLSTLNSDLDKKTEILKDIEENDDIIYRSYIETEPIPYTIRKAGIGGTDRYRHFSIYKSGEQLTTLAKKADLIQNQIKIQNGSFDEITELVNNKKEFYSQIPSICPMSNRDFYRISAYFGSRFHPVYRHTIQHTGIDFASTIGSPVYATGEGVVTDAGWYMGYGNRIVIDHGFGYTTVYAHLSKIKVKEGTKVNRGKLIGLVGTTGVSTGPHLHYEVRKGNVPINPIRFFCNDLSEEEYKQIIHQ